MKKDYRLQIMMTPAEVAAIDAWRIAHLPLGSRAEAIRQIVAERLRADTKKAD